MSLTIPSDCLAGENHKRRGRRALSPVNRFRLAGVTGAVGAAVQQYISSALSVPCPRIRQPQCAQVGAKAWMAHSKLSKVPDWSPLVMVNVLS
ncbi:hypothetical protein QFZ79_003373 [Arthrobacter sp. V4I6]|nr:hypothetical protein [Arthrobacter sp. V1I7]MDQ0855262.1 hypothetical protein [Arthrobacter sp. V4I6]